MFPHVVCLRHKLGIKINYNLVIYIFVALICHSNKKKEKKEKSTKIYSNFTNDIWEEKKTYLDK